MMLIYEDMRGISSQYMKERKPLIDKRSRFIFTVHERKVKINFNYLSNSQIFLFICERTQGYY